MGASYNVSFTYKMGLPAWASHFNQLHVMKFVTTQRGARSLIYVKATSILSTEEEEMAAFLKNFC